MESSGDITSLDEKMEEDMEPKSASKVSRRNSSMKILSMYIGNPKISSIVNKKIHHLSKMKRRYEKKQTPKEKFDSKTIFGGLKISTSKITMVRYYGGIDRKFQNSKNRLSTSKTIL